MTVVVRGDVGSVQAAVDAGAAAAKAVGRTRGVARDPAARTTAWSRACSS